MNDDPAGEGIDPFALSVQASVDRINPFDLGVNPYLEQIDPYLEQIDAHVDPKTLCSPRAGVESRKETVMATKKASSKKASSKKVPKNAPAAKKKSVPAAPKLMTSTELAASFGVKLTPRLKTDAVRRLRKALPGYVGLLDDVAALLEEDASLLNLRDITPADLLDLQARQKFLSAREGLIEGVYRSIYEQRLQVDDEAMGKLLKIARRIDSAAEDDPDVRVRWKTLLDFLAKFRRGGSTAAPSESVEEGAEEETSPA